MATITATQALAGIQPRGNHNGVDAVTSTLTFGDQLISASAGDILLWCKIPNGSTLLAIQSGGVVTGTNATESFLVGATTLTGSTTLAASGFHANASLPFTVSLSDDAVPQHVFLNSLVVVVTSGSGTGAISRTAYITRDP